MDAACAVALTSHVAHVSLLSALTLRAVCIYTQLRFTNDDHEKFAYS